MSRPDEVAGAARSGTGPMTRPPSRSAVSVADRTELLEPGMLRPAVRGDAGFFLVLAGLVLSCFAGHWHDIGVPLPLDRALLLLGLALEWARARRSRTLPRLDGTVVLLIAAAAWAALSFIGSTVRDSGGFYFLLDLYLVPTLLFVSAPVVFGTRHRRFLLEAAFAVFGIYLGATAIAEALHLSAVIVPSYIADPAVGLHYGRARGPYVEAVNNGMMLIFSGALGAHLASSATSRRWRIAGGTAALLCAVGCALTLTRAIWIASGVAVVIAIVSMPALRRRLPIVLTAIAAAVAVFPLVFPDFLVAATDRGEAKTPIYDRLDVAQGATSMALQHPLFGVGWDQAGLQMGQYVRLGADYPVTAASAVLIPHNVFLGRFAELGIPGATLWLASVVAVLIVPVLRRSRRGFGGWRLVLLACALCWLIIANFGPVNYSEPQYLLYLIGGITASGRAVVPQPWDWSDPRRPSRVDDLVASRVHRRSHRAPRGGRR